VDELDAPGYLLFLAIFCGCINLVGGFGLRAVPKRDDNASEIHVVENPQPRSDALPAAASSIDPETMPLLPRSSPPRDYDKLLTLIFDIDFLLFAFVLLCCMGMSEMVICNIGTIVASFTPSASEASKTTVGSQVRLLSLANTLSRLITGPLADFTSPLPIRHPSGELHFHPKRSITRVVFVFVTAALLLCASMWMAFGPVSLDGVWFFSLLTGAAYGMIWTVMPSIVEGLWGTEHVARNFGTITYAPFIGTPIFSLLYAYLSEKARDLSTDDPICRGPACWQPTFTICCAVLLCVMGTTMVLWKRCKNLV